MINPKLRDIYDKTNPELLKRLESLLNRYADDIYVSADVHFNSGEMIFPAIILVDNFNAPYVREILSECGDTYSWIEVRNLYSKQYNFFKLLVED